MSCMYKAKGEEEMKWHDNKTFTKLKTFDKMINPKKKYWSGLDIIKTGCHYNIIFSERATGKTTYFQCLAIWNYYMFNRKTCYIVRTEKELKNYIMKKSYVETSNMYSEKITNGKWNEVVYKERGYWLAKRDEDGNIETDSTPFMICVALSAVTETKSKINDNSIDLVWFEEFMTRSQYLPNEFIEFQNMISTIVRLRDDTIVIMTANTVNKYCPYFEEMGLYRVKQQPIGTIDIYEYGESCLRVATEYTEPSSKQRKQKKSNIYFSFDNPRLQMVKTGEWEIASYPHVMWHTGFDDKLFDNVFVCFNNEYIRISAYIHNDDFVYLTVTNFEQEHPFYNDDYVFVDCPPIRANEKLWFHGKMGEYIMKHLSAGSVFYQDNTIGERLNNYLKCMKQYSIIKQ